MTIDVNFFENLSDDLKRTVSDASKAIMDVYERNTFDTEIKSTVSKAAEFALESDLPDKKELLTDIYI